MNKRTKRTKRPQDTSPRVIRGGGWNNNVPSWVHAASRYSIGPAGRNGDIGFRCALRGRQPRV